MNTNLLGTVLIVVGGIVVQLLIYRSNEQGRKATQAVENKKVDLEEFREVQARNEAALERADKAQARSDARIAHLEEVVMEERNAREAADERAQRAEERAQRAEERAAAAVTDTGRLTRRVAQLEQVLRDNQMTVPPPLLD